MKQDPFNLLEKKVISEHCRDKISKIILYDNTGAAYVVCQCSLEYWHNDKRGYNFGGCGAGG